MFSKSESPFMEFRTHTCFEGRIFPLYARHAIASLFRCEIIRHTPSLLLVQAERAGPLQSIRQMEFRRLLCRLLEPLRRSGTYGSRVALSTFVWMRPRRKIRLENSCHRPFNIGKSSIDCLLGNGNLYSLIALKKIHVSCSCIPAQDLLRRPCV